MNEVEALDSDWGLAEDGGLSMISSTILCDTNHGTRKADWLNQW